MRKDRRKLAKLFFIIFSLSLVILLTVSVGHVEHNCFNEDCVICYEINLMKNIFENLLILSLVYVFVKEFENFIILSRSFFDKKYCLTPVLLKVRLIE